MTNSSMPDATLLTSAIKDIQSVPILVVGDVMLDRYVQGTVTRISPEAPIPVLLQNHESCVPGGAANVARNLSHLGCSIKLIGPVGKDEQADLLSDALSPLPQFSFQPIISDTKPTTTKTRFMASNQQILRLDNEQIQPISSEQEQQIVSLVTEMLASLKIIILSDYAKGCLTPALIKQIIGIAKTHKLPVIIDPKSTDLSVYAGADLLTPNLKELQLAAGRNISSFADIEDFSKQILAHHDIGAMLVTLGAQGMLLVTSTTTRHISAHASDVFDVSGAGDTVIASMGAMIAAGYSVLEAALMGNLAASLVVSKLGTASLSPGELLAPIASTYRPPSLEMLAEQVKQWQQQGLKVGFTNGCFDILHPGHLHVLMKTANACDKLIIGLNSDSSITKLKGENRPVQSQSLRQNILTCLPFVDAVILFDEDTPINLITKLQPDLLTKGGDYQAEDIVGFKEVTARNGIVTIIPLLERYSTTSFLASHQLG